MDDLTKLRQEIDKIDNELIVLFEKRMEIVKRVAEYKKNNNMPIYDESRENEIIKNNVEKLNNKSFNHELEIFYKTIFKISKDIQKKELEKNIVLIGMPGSGKTTIGKKLAQKLNLSFYDSDNYIEKDTGKSISEIFQNGEDYFRQLETKAIKELALKVSSVIATGGGAVKREENILALKNKGVIIFINRPLEKIAENIDTEKRPLLKAKKENLYKLFDERIGLYKKYCDYEVKNDKNICDVVNDIISIIT